MPRLRGWGRWRGKGRGRGGEGGFKGVGGGGGEIIVIKTDYTCKEKLLLYKMRRENGRKNKNWGDVS